MDSTARIRGNRALEDEFRSPTPRTTCIITHMPRAPNIRLHARCLLPNSAPFCSSGCLPHVWCRRPWARSLFLLMNTLRQRANPSRPRSEHRPNRSSPCERRQRSISSHAKGPVLALTYGLDVRNLTASLGKQIHAHTEKLRRCRIAYDGRPRSSGDMVTSAVGAYDADGIGDAVRYGVSDFFAGAPEPFEYSLSIVLIVKPPDFHTSFILLHKISSLIAVSTDSLRQALTVAETNRHGFVQKAYSTTQTSAVFCETKHDECEA
ncbi:hypothetical protein M422DRAFT_28002 [Sphaerobolus stellatus SS14]|nr:hypothetical protein M422DRAFT_28002 [Sphaerobolus stellatus SS14]